MKFSSQNKPKMPSARNKCICWKTTYNISLEHNHLNVWKANATGWNIQRIPIVVCKVINSPDGIIRSTFLYTYYFYVYRHRCVLTMGDEAMAVKISFMIHAISEISGVLWSFLLDKLHVTDMF